VTPSPTTNGRRPSCLRRPIADHPRSVFQILRRHFARYTPEIVQRVCGVDPSSSRNCSPRSTSNSTPERTTALLLLRGPGPAHHRNPDDRGLRHRSSCSATSAGGRCGIMALRGPRNDPGQPDIPTLFNLLPGTTMPAHQPTA
jgi:formate dehydrogenase major subunit